MGTRTINKTLAGLILVLMIAVVSALMTPPPIHAVDNELPPVSNLFSLMQKGYVCVPQPPPGPFAPPTWICLDTSSGHVYFCQTEAFCVRVARTVDPKKRPGTGIVTTPTDAQQPSTTPTAGTGVIVNPAGTRDTPTTTVPTPTAGSGLAVKPVGAITS